MPDKQPNDHQSEEVSPNEEQPEVTEQDLEAELAAVDGAGPQRSAQVDVDDQQASPDKEKDPFQRLQKKKVARPKTLKPTSGKVKRGSKISPKVFLIGCVIFFIIFLGIVFAGLYFALTSSDFLQTVGLEVDEVKNILIIFAVLFFGIIFFGGFYVLVLNIYRLVTTKGKKAKYVVGLVLGFIVITLSIVFGVLSITRIRELTGSSQIVTDQLVLPYVETKDDQVRVSQGIPIIAPVGVRYQLNKDQFDRNILSEMGQNVTNFILDCGNGQQIEGNQSMHLAGGNSFFTERCLYLEKGDYPIALTVEYYNRAAGEDQSKTYQVGNLTVQAAIQLDAIEDEPRLNDQGTELIIGVAPVTVQFRGQLLFTDLGLSDDDIIWDLESDGNADLENNASFDHPFNQSRLHRISYQLPGLPNTYNDTWFAFDLRVVESELAKCQIQTEEVEDKRYRMTPQFDELVNIAKYTYIIYDTTLETIVEKINANQEQITYQFTEGGEYEISMMYFTPEGEKGSCDPKPLTVGFDGNQVEFDLKFRQDESVPFVAVGEDTEVQRDEVENVISVRMLPAILEISVTDIFPDPNADLKVYYDGRQLFEERPDVYEVNIGSLGQKDLTFELTTPQGKKTTQEYTVDVSRASVRALIQAEPLVGESPLEVELDASASPLYDEEDEIVFFTRDFGDGENLTNVSQGKVTHTYKYDVDNENGEFYPSVTVKTRKGFEDTYRMTEAINVKKKQREVELRVTSHPTQQARVGDSVEFSIETDGMVEHIDRDFGNQKTRGCDDRSCSSVTTMYLEEGDYTVTVEVQYANDTPVKERTKLRVYR